MLSIHLLLLTLKQEISLRPSSIETQALERRPIPPDSAKEMQKRLRLYQRLISRFGREPKLQRGGEDRTAD